MAAMTRGIIISLFMSFFMKAKHTCLIVYELEMSWTAQEIFTSTFDKNSRIHTADILCKHEIEK